MSTPIYNRANIERFEGVAPLYANVRPAPPQAILDILTQLAGVAKPRLVVDLGCGTGLSTRIWAGRAEQVVGVEPGADMRRQAEAQSTEPNIRYLEGFSHDTGLPDGCADIVTCSQSLHWMEPEPTFAEVARILRTGGVLAAYDNDWPPTCNPEAEIAYTNFETRAVALSEARGLNRPIKHLNKESHLDRMRASGRFRYTKEIVLHHIEQGDAKRLVGLALSQGGVAVLFKNGMTEQEVGVPEFRRAVELAMGDRNVPFCFSYRMRVGIK
jgi:SAM-dependent methyltransferase